MLVTHFMAKCTASFSLHHIQCFVIPDQMELVPGEPYAVGVGPLDCFAAFELDLLGALVADLVLKGLGLHGQGQDPLLSVAMVEDADGQEDDRADDDKKDGCLADPFVCPAPSLLGSLLTLPHDPNL